MSPLVYLLRHGETEWSRAGRHTGRTDLPLTGHGEDQARAAGAVLRGLLDGAVARVVTSPRRRALHTAELAGLAVDERTEDLAEWDYGEYEGLTTSQIREQVPGWTVWTHPCPGGEGATEVSARADRLLDRIRGRAGTADRPVVLAGHGQFSRVLAARWIGLPASAGAYLAHDAGALTVLGYEREQPQLRHVNLGAR